MASYKAFSALKTWTTNNWVYDLGAGGIGTVGAGDTLTITGAGTGPANGFRPGAYAIDQYYPGYATGTADGAQNLAHLTLNPLNDASGNRAGNASVPAVGGGTGYVGTPPPPVPALSVGALGDSITSQAFWVASFQAAMGAAMGILPAQVAVTNRGIVGRTSTNFLPTVASGGEDMGTAGGGAASGQSDLQAAIAAFVAAGCSVVIILLGANDSKFGAVQTSVGAYQGNIQAICAAIALGCPLVKLILLNAPFSPLPGAGGAWDGSSVAILPRYGVALRLVSVPSGVVRLGDISLPALMLATPSLTVDLVHPGSVAGGNLVGAAWAAALAPILTSMMTPPVPATSVAITSPVPPALPGGSTLQLAAAVFPAGANQSVTWAATVYNADGTTAPGTISAGGLLTLPALANIGKRMVVTATATGGNTFTTASIYVSPETVDSITVFAPFAADGGTQVQLAATVNGANAPGTGVTWAANLLNVDGTAGAVQTISAGGLLTLPATPPTNQTVIVTATSAMDTTKSGSASILVPAAGDSLKAGDLNAQYAISKSLRGAVRS